VSRSFATRPFTIAAHLHCSTWWFYNLLRDYGVSHPSIGPQTIRHFTSFTADTPTRELRRYYFTSLQERDQLQQLGSQLELTTTHRIVLHRPRHASSNELMLLTPDLLQHGAISGLRQNFGVRPPSRRSCSTDTPGTRALYDFTEN